MASAHILSPVVAFGFGISPRNKIYLKISESLSEDEVKSLRAMLITDHHIAKGKIENATPHEIFNMLEDDRKIGEGNLGLLIELLKALGKTQMAEELEKDGGMTFASVSKEKVPEDASSIKRTRVESWGSNDSGSPAEIGIGWSSSSSPSMSLETEDFVNGGNLAASAEGTANGPVLATVGDVRKRIEELQAKIAKLKPIMISKTKREEMSKACNELKYLFKLLEDQSTGELKVDIALLNTEIREEFKAIYESGALHEKIGKEVENIMRSNCADITNVESDVKVEFSSNASESPDSSPGRCATIKVTAEHVDLADSCKLDKDSVVRHLFQYLVENSQNLHPILKYLNSFFVQVKTISYGSIDFECLCLTPESAIRLQEEYDGKTLQTEIQRVISSLATLADFGIKSIFLDVQLKFANEGPVLVSKATNTFGIYDCDTDLSDTAESSGLGSTDFASTTEDEDDTDMLGLRRTGQSYHIPPEIHAVQEQKNTQKAGFKAHISKAHIRHFQELKIQELKRQIKHVMNDHQESLQSRYTMEQKYKEEIEKLVTRHKDEIEKLEKQRKEDIEKIERMEWELTRLRVIETQLQAIDNQAGIKVAEVAEKRCESTSAEMTGRRLVKRPEKAKVDMEPIESPEKGATCTIS